MGLSQFMKVIWHRRVEQWRVEVASGIGRWTERSTIGHTVIGYVAHPHDRWKQDQGGKQQPGTSSVYPPIFQTPMLNMLSLSFYKYLSIFLFCFSFSLQRAHPTCSLCLFCCFVCLKLKTKKGEVCKTKTQPKTGGLLCAWSFLSFQHGGSLCLRCCCWPCGWSQSPFQHDSNMLTSYKNTTPTPQCHSVC